MEFRPLEFSIVVVANDCNPTILNPDFLTKQGIVRDEWEWKLSGTPITTPPFAIVSYENGISISVEPNKFQIVDRLLSNKPNKSQIPQIACKYIQVLPHVRYTAVGHNFRGLLEHEKAKEFLRKRFIKDGVWDSNKRKLEGISLKFVYPLKGGRLNISLDAADIIDRSADPLKESHGILIQVNYHRDCQGYPSDKQVVEHFNHTKEDWLHCRATISDILG